MDINRRLQTLSSQKISPALKAMKNGQNRSMINGGITVDFSANTETIRDIGRRLGYNIFQDAALVYVPSSYGEARGFTQTPNLKNLAAFSEEIDNAAWTKFNLITVTAGTITSPIGTLTAEKIIPNTISANHRVNGTLLNIFSGVCTYSIYAKAGEYSGLWLRFLPTPNVPEFSATFDLTGGTITQVTTGNTANIVDAGNGWFRCSIIFTLQSATTANSYYCYIQPSATQFPLGVNYTGDGVSGLYLWGAQVEMGSGATSYQVTTTSYLDFLNPRTTIARTMNKDGFIEDSCYNFLSQSESFDNAYWTKLNSSITGAIANTDISPTGYRTGDGFLETVTNGVHTVTNSTIPQIYANNTYTFSIYAKPNGRNRIRLDLHATPFGANRFAIFDFSSTTVVQSSNLDNASIVLDGNGYYQLSITGMATADTITNAFTIGGIISGTTNSYVGNITLGYYLWGAQCVIGSTPRPYLRTTTRVSMPCLDYSRSFTKPQLMLELSKSNILLYSETLTNPAWLNSGTTVSANTHPNPFNLNRSFDLYEDTNNSTHYLSQNKTVTAALPVITSWYMKKADHSWVQLAYGTSGFASTNWVNFNFDTGTFGNSGSTAIFDVRALNNGYYQVSLRAQSIATFTGGTEICIIAGTDNQNVATRLPSYVGTNAKIADIAAAQYESGPLKSSYMPTTASLFTRTAEFQSIDIFNKNLLNINNFTLYMDMYSYASGTSSSMSVGVALTTVLGSAEHLSFHGGGGGVMEKGNVQTLVGTNLPNGTPFKGCIRRNGTTVTWFRNGVQLGTPQTVPVYPYRYAFIADGGAQYGLNAFVIFNRSLSDAECITLSTL